MSRVLEKLARITEEDISAALAGVGPTRDIRPEEVEEYATAKGRARGRSYGGKGAIGGSLAGALVGLPIGLATKGRGAGALAGALGGGLLGAGIGGGAGYFGGRGSGRREGRYFGTLAQVGKLPPYLPEHVMPSTFLRYAKGTQPGLTKDLSPEEYKKLRKELAAEGFASGLLSGATSGLENIQASLELGELSGPGAIRRIMSPIAEGLAEAEARRQEAAGLSKKLLDLYHRGYGHLAERIRASYGD